MENALSVDYHSNFNSSPAHFNVISRSTFNFYEKIPHKIIFSNILHYLLLPLETYERTKKINIILRIPYSFPNKLRCSLTPKRNRRISIDKLFAESLRYSDSHPRSCG